MKLYIENFGISNLVKTLGVLEKYPVHKKYKSEIYSDDGIYNVNNIDLYKCVIKDDDIKKIDNYYNDKSLLIDNSKVTYIKWNQIPYEHIILHTCEFHYLVNNLVNQETSIIFVIIGKKVFDRVYNMEEEIKLNYKDLDLMDFYFEVSDTLDIHHETVKQEINEFLSLLN